MNKPAMLSMDDALVALLANATPIVDTETVSTFEAHGRVLARAVRSTLNVPPADNTSMDGYAVRSADAATTGAVLRVAQRIPAGTVGVPLEAGTAARIFTGALVPPGADAVVMQESTTVDGDKVTINEAVKPGQWVRYAGEDIKEGAEVLSPGTRLSPQACGLAASVGMANLEVLRRLKVAVFFTGDELAMPGEPLKPGAIYNSNRFMLRGLIESLGCTCTDLGIVRDNLDDTRAVLRQAAAGHDLIITTGGVSVGEEDHVRPAVEAEGEIKLWQIAMKPGKPLAYGRVRRNGGVLREGRVQGNGGAPEGAMPHADGGTANFIGLPGNPVSSFATFLLFVRPFILTCQGVADVAPKALTMTAEFDLPKGDRRREFLRARMTPTGGLELFPNQSSGVLTSTVWGDGLIDNPPNQTIKRGDAVRFLPFASLLN